MTAALLVWALAASLAAAGYGLALRRQVGTKEEAWDSGFRHGVRVAHAAVAKLPKPWITLGEERGWELARAQIADHLYEMVEAVDGEQADAPA